MLLFQRCDYQCYNAVIIEDVIYITNRAVEASSDGKDKTNRKREGLAMLTCSVSGSWRKPLPAAQGG
jgi:hypothetical protein